MNLVSKQIESQVLNNEIEKFLRRGGAIQNLPRGYSGLSDELKPTQKMRSIMSASIVQARAQSNNPSVIAWREAKEKGLKHFNGTACITCGSTLRYTSTRSCFSCNKASSLRRAERKRKERAS
jgi:hypothetical protein